MTETYPVALDLPSNGRPPHSWRLAINLEDAQRTLWSTYPGARIDESWQLRSDPPSGQKVEIMSAWSAPERVQEGSFVALIRRLIVSSSPPGAQLLSSTRLSWLVAGLRKQRSFCHAAGDGTYAPNALTRTQLGVSDRSRMHRLTCALRSIQPKGAMIGVQRKTSCLAGADTTATTASAVYPPPALTVAREAACERPRARSGL
jgi:hypothetical protein